MVECDKSDLGCNGGMLDSAWHYLETTGIVSDKCNPYISGDGKADKCPLQCSGKDTPYKKYKCKAGTVVEATTAE